MAKVAFYFQVHQPWRLKRKYIFDSDPEIFDIEKNKEIFTRVANKCYIPATKLLIKLAKKYPEFKVSFSFTGTFFEQAERFYPEVINVFQELWDTGQMDLLEETYYHSLAYLISKEEFKEQIEMHKELMRKYFNYKPIVFRNTEAMFSEDIATFVGKLGYKGIIAEGWDKVLEWRSPNYVYTNKNMNIKVLLRNYKLSDDIGFRFSWHQWNEFPLTAEKYASWVALSEGQYVGLFLDYETFGEHQWKETGIFDFLERLPKELIARGVGFFKISELTELKPVGIFTSDNIISWADVDRDLSAWLGNKMQNAAFEFLKSLEKDVKARDGEVLKLWRNLGTSDNFYYICTKWFAEGDIHKYFNAYDSPYSAYINYMNILNLLKINYLESASS
ncbi:MAG: glycoside hydrolase family 57 protein [Candidatus Rehaiarchaeum fermentans]|nr:glycoside hydrolase family 57 protein [Candidatus Rehaiarchaeum fermentans]